ncbi:MAG: hypothetical protein IPH44_03135 [Myxococcales bacterium]|nr:hypothetical protein [Myxococcales bacterium]MBK7198315.1 hypothetical protein [Myxococcales bacterium]MBP6843737.1 hypothetical protein [Kofleriaceae bacterium]
MHAELIRRAACSIAARTPGPARPRTIRWREARRRDNLDFVQVFVHGTTTDVGAGRTQGPFDPTAPANPEHVELAAALQAAYLRAPRAESP